MSLQIILRNPESIVALGDLEAASDIFSLDNGMMGIAIPTRVVESIGQDVIAARLAGTEHFDLWAGEWNAPNPIVAANSAVGHATCLRTRRARPPPGRPLTLGESR